MLTRRELIPLALALALFGGIGSMALDVRRGAARSAARSAPAVELAGASFDAGGSSSAEAAPDPARVVHPSDLGGLPLREATLPAPTRDAGAIRRAIERGAPGTYLPDIIEKDSTLIRWPDRTVEALRVWVQPSSPVPHWNDRFPGMVRDVFPEWSEAGFPIRFQHVVDSAAADLHVVFTDALPGRQIGVTRRIRDRSGWIVASEITIATQDEAGRPFPPELVSGIARHELGHALGLGHANDSATVMFPESHTTTIMPADRATLRLLYTLPPGPVPSAP